METPVEFNSLSMTGLYIHLPFCRKKCGYCDFYSIHANSQHIEDYIRLLCEEIHLREAAFPYLIKSIYLGGGTPSLVPITSIADLIHSLQQNFKFESNLEVTMEVNPGTIDQAVWCKYREIGINRISLGIQSFLNSELKMLGRIHQAEEAKQAYKDARAQGFENIGIDLIYGLPGQTTANWEETLSEAIDLEPDHISAYSLSLSADVPMAAKIDKGFLPSLDEDLAAELMEITHEKLSKAGYEHYEISNYAKPGFQCQHNLIYWQGESYLGLGASAHSFDQNRRWWNVSDIGQYKNLINKNQLPTEDEEHLNEIQVKLEKIALGLRTMSGVPISTVIHATEKVNQLIQEKKAIIENDQFILTQAGFLIADEIAVQLL